MNLLHLSDLHLGKVVNEISMLEDQKYILSKVIDLIDEEKIDAVMMAGDIYDRKVPSEEAVALLDDFLSKLAAKKIPVLMISGNHDSDERLNFGSRIFSKNGIYVAGKYTGKINKVTLNDDYGPVNFYLMPFTERNQVEYYFPDDDTSTYEAAVNTALSHTGIDYSERNILLAHLFAISGTSEPELSGSETSAKNVGTIDKVSSGLFSEFEYTALGHIHRPQKVGSENVRYGGSLLKYSLNEINQSKAFTIVTINEKGTGPDINLIPIKPLHEMRELKGNFDELMKPENIEFPDDYIFMTLKDKTPIADAYAIAESRYKNLMGLRYDNSESKLADTEEINEGESGRDFSEMMADFYKKILGREPEDDEWKILNEVAKEAGVTE